eukprot:CAMPEP_0201553248 /NCGR_PEP_ID=MMETSP0173_2-20130828/20342_1 /ASSEMBLY_ACC=CAM_ASM_000268 /TAXON_ID=218659 /ORGANISM="Vexillifera sp., Strain DIVA3 564/2" /LENGTH=204 /DNA_ID=CAMNT_0047963889 /DNA_START=30 /DNA_END=640 /DNA_ORIENTATION=+
MIISESQQFCTIDQDKVPKKSYLEHYAYKGSYSLVNNDLAIIGSSRALRVFIILSKLSAHYQKCSSLASNPASSQQVLADNVRSEAIDKVTSLCTPENPSQTRVPPLLQMVAKGLRPAQNETKLISLAATNLVVDVKAQTCQCTSIAQTDIFTMEPQFSVLTPNEEEEQKKAFLSSPTKDNGKQSKPRQSKSRKSLFAFGKKKR